MSPSLAKHSTRKASRSVILTLSGLSARTALIPTNLGLNLKLRAQHSVTSFLVFCSLFLCRRANSALLRVNTDVLLEVFAVVFTVFVSFSSEKTVILSGFDVCEARDNISMSHACSASEFNGNCLRIFYNNRNAIVQFLAIRLHVIVCPWCGVGLLYLRLSVCKF